MSSQTAAQANPRKQQELQNQYTVYKNTLQQIAQKIGDVEQEAEEHKLVLETLQPLSGDRKAFRLINGVLMEQTVQDVMPALKTNSEGLKKVLEDLVKQYKTKQDELEKWKKKHNIQVVQSHFSEVSHMRIQIQCALTPPACLQTTWHPTRKSYSPSIWAPKPSNNQVTTQPGDHIDDLAPTVEPVYPVIPPSQATARSPV
ncbi:hypothetical protein VDGE_03018 [Verticillium dahliae]|uniref:Prefoldin subunit 2 n=1 Tax=Verticillium dahliae TaxID=27337 RepID=A0A444RQE0_VERDA|nr:hypothetical protein VDGE_03018 [Verticillium dahliae]